MNPELVETLRRFNQIHAIRFIDELDANSRWELENELANIDFELITALHASRGTAQYWTEMAQHALPPVAIRLNHAEDNPITRDEANERGAEALAADEIGMVLVAGGQGTRLGFPHPKGMLPMGPVSGRTLFQIHIDKLLAIHERYGVAVPLYVMTSPATHAETEAFLNRHDWFGYPRGARNLFCQGTMPALDIETGRLLLRARGRLAHSPDGHGGMLAALVESGSLNNLTNRGARQVFYCQVDNPLCQICDAATIGYHLLTGSEMTSQAIPKADPLQHVGNLVEIDGKIRVIEYSDLPDEVATATNADGSLRLWAGSIAVHVFDVDFLNRMSEHANALPFHLARKKVPYIDARGERVEPDEPYALKFVRFIFDVLPLAGHSIVVEVVADEAFSPVKNADSAPKATVATARQAMSEQARRRLRDAGVAFDESVAMEISPRLMDDPAALKARTAELPAVNKPLFIH